MMRYQQNFKRVLSHIEDNLSEPIDLAQLCQLAHLSKFHFHRLCRGYFGLPLMSLVQVMRLKRAAYQLAYRHEFSIIDIALDNGYQSHEGFSRRFKKVFGLSPLHFRQSPDWSAWQQYYEPLMTMRTKLMPAEISFKVDLVDFDSLPIAVMQHRGAPQHLSQTIAAFISWRRQNKLSPSVSRTFNIIYDDPNTTPPEDYRFDLACSYRNRPNLDEETMVFAELPALKCAHIRHIGHEESLFKAVDYLYTHWLEKFSYQLADFPLFIERVSFFPEVAEQEMVTDIYLPII